MAQEAHTRRIVAGLFVSLDGIADSEAASAHSHINPEMVEEMAAGLAQADAVLLGPRTYQMFTEIWQPQGSSSAMATFLNHSPKFVVSHTRPALEWQPATLITGDVAAALRQLKQQPGKNIQVPGSPRLVRWLLRAGLLDELSLSICPVVVGPGLRLFDEITQPVHLKLIDSRTYSNGVVGVTYQRG